MKQKTNEIEKKNSEKEDRKHKVTKRVLARTD